MEVDSASAIAAGEAGLLPTEGKVSLVWEAVSSVPVKAKGDPFPSDNVIG